jgi:hypothetical protein
VLEAAMLDSLSASPPTLDPNFRNLIHFKSLLYPSYSERDCLVVDSLDALPKSAIAGILYTSGSTGFFYVALVSFYPRLCYFRFILPSFMLPSFLLLLFHFTLVSFFYPLFAGAPKGTVFTEDLLFPSEGTPNFFQ